MEFLAGLHPKVVHFPVALLVAYSCLEITGILFKKEFIQKTAYLILCLAVVSALAAVLTGNQAFAAFTSWNNESREIFNRHELFANITVWSSAIVLVLRTYFLIKKKLYGIKKFIFIIFAIIIVYFVFQTGRYGSELVYKYGVGTELHSSE